MTWTIEYRKSVRKQVAKLSPAIRNRIKDFLQDHVAHLENVRSIGKALSGPDHGGHWRYRVGDYRIICDIQDRKLIVLVVEIGHRSGIYR